MSKDVLFEIGLEELPARFIDDAQKQLVEKTKKWLNELHIPYDLISSFSTPRRLAVLINGIAPEQITTKEETKGPAEKIAKDENGNWTKAAIGFTKGQGKTLDDIYTKEINGSTYIFIENHIEGQPTIDLLPTFCNIIESIQFKENMRWGQETLKYARPIRWLVALYDEQVIPFEIAHVKTNKITYGHRFLGKEITLKNPLEYEEELRKNFVIANPKKREQLILAGINTIEKKENFDIVVDEDLLNEVRNLIEFPTAFYGSYNESFLNLPSEVLITSMKEHQRYFPVRSKDGNLLPHFISVRNGDNHEIDAVVRGNEKVLHARLSDAQFFYKEDKKKSINFYLEKLERVVFQEKIGTISDKVRNVVLITKQLAQLLKLEETTTQQAIRVAEICKFDLMTNMVNEFTELQGIMGEKYALNFGEDKMVARAIREHYLPVQANGELPISTVGAIVSIADKLDTIVSCISVGLIPTGSQDPYGLRRQAIGILRILEDNQWNVTLERLLEITEELYRTRNADQDTTEKATNDLENFFKHRATYLLKGIGIEQDVIQSVLHKEIGTFSYTIAKASILSDKHNDNEFKHVQEALVRILNLSTKIEQIDVNPALFKTSSEQLLFEQYERVYTEYNLSNEQQKAEQALLQLGKLAEPIHSFFENNMVMDKQEALRNNRLCLVNKIAQLIYDFADLSVIEWKQHFK